MHTLGAERAGRPGCEPAPCDNPAMASRDAAERLRTALVLFEDGVDLMRATLRRRHPDASEEHIERLIGAWLAERPGAEDGDALGRPPPPPA